MATVTAQDSLLTEILMREHGPEIAAITEQRYTELEEMMLLDFAAAVADAAEADKAGYAAADELRKAREKQEELECKLREMDNAVLAAKGARSRAWGERDVMKKREQVWRVLMVACRLRGASLDDLNSAVASAAAGKLDESDIAHTVRERLGVKKDADWREMVAGVVLGADDE